MKKVFLQLLLAVGLVAMGYSAEPPSATPQNEKIAGQIKDEQGHPVKDAKVFISTARVRSGTSTLCPSCYKDCRKSATSDAAGSFEIPNVANDLTFRLLVASTGFAPKYIDDVDPRKGGINIILKMRSERNGFQLKGKVVEQNGKPVMGALIYPYSSTTKECATPSPGVPSGMESIAITDTNGDFTLLAAPDCATAGLEISANVFSNKKFPGVRIDTEPHKFILDQGAMITGRLMAEGKPVEGVEVGIIVTDRNWDNFYSELVATTDKQGRFIFSNVPASREFFIYGLRSSLLDRGATASKRITTGAAGTSLDVGEIAVDRGCRITGHMTLSDGKPVPPDTRVQIGRESAWDPQVLNVGVDGKFSFRAIQGEKIELNISIKDYTLEGSTDDFHREIQFVVDKDDISLKFTRLPKLHGKVMTSEGKAATNAEVTLAAELISGVTVVNGKVGPLCKPKPIHSDAEGKFELPLSATLSTNNHILAVHNEGYALIPEGEFQGAMTLTPWCRVEGKAFEGNLPATNCSVSLEKIVHGSKDIGWYIALFDNAEVDSSGRFTLDRIPEGLACLALYRKTGQKDFVEVLRKNISVTKQGMQPISLGSVGSTISGSVILSKELQSQTNWYQMLFAENDPTHLTYIFRVHHDGTFEILNVPPGEYRMNISFENVGKENMIQGRASTNISVPPGAQTLKLAALKLQNESPPLKPGDSFPIFSAITTEGKTISNKDLLGKVTLLHFDRDSGRGGLFAQICVAQNWKNMRKISDKFQLITFRPQISFQETFPKNDPRNLPWDVCLISQSEDSEWSKILNDGAWDAFYLTAPDGKILKSARSQNDIWEPVQNALNGISLPSANQ